MDACCRIEPGAANLEIFRCDGPGCQIHYHTKEEAFSLKKCGRCLTLSFCSEKCQKNSWKTHKKECQWHPSLVGFRPGEPIPEKVGNTESQFAQAVGDFLGVRQYERKKTVSPLCSKAPMWLEDPRKFADIYCKNQTMLGKHGVVATLRARIFNKFSFELALPSFFNQRKADKEYRELSNQAPTCDCCGILMAGCTYECICGEFYCSKKCQIKHWKNHREVCHTIRENNLMAFLYTEMELSMSPIIEEI